MARLGDHLGVSDEERGNSYHFFRNTFCGSRNRLIGDYGITYARVQNCNRHQGYRKLGMLEFPFKPMAFKNVAQDIMLKQSCPVCKITAWKLSLSQGSRERMKPVGVEEPKTEPRKLYSQSPRKAEKSPFKETEQEPAKHFLTSSQFYLKVIHSCLETSHIYRGAGQVLPVKRNKLVINAPLGLKGSYSPLQQKLQKAKRIHTLEENASTLSTQESQEQLLTGRFGKLRNIGNSPEGQINKFGTSALHHWADCYTKFQSQSSHPRRMHFPTTLRTDSQETPAPGTPVSSTICSHQLLTSSNFMALFKS